MQASRVRTAVGKAAQRNSARHAPRTTWPPSPSRARSPACPQLDRKEIEDVIIGCAMPEAEQGMNVARIASLRAGLPVEVRRP